MKGSPNEDWKLVQGMGWGLRLYMYKNGGVCSVYRQGMEVADSNIHCMVYCMFCGLDLKPIT